jgi:hypothetical protein
MKAAFSHIHPKAALLFAGKTDIRYYLSAVLFSGGTGELVATDGHRMIVIETHWRSDDGQVLIPRTLIENVLKITKGTDETIAMDYDVATRKVTLGGLTELEVDSRFPDYKVITPNKADCLPSPSVINPMYLVDASKAHCLIHGLTVKGNYGMDYVSRKPNHADTMTYMEMVNAMSGQINAHFGKGFTVTIMPLRVTR